jgi:hypothetical protein
VHRLGPESCSQQVAPKASPTWPCGEVMAELHLAGWCLSGCTALSSELLRGGTGLLDSALVTCSLKKKLLKPKIKKNVTPYTLVQGRATQVQGLSQRSRQYAQSNALGGPQEPGLYYVEGLEQNSDIDTTRTHLQRSTPAIRAHTY